MKSVRITGMGTYLPRNMLGNDDLPPLDKPISPERLARIGVERRGHASDDETIAVMAAEASRAALHQADVAATDLDFIIVANWTQRRFFPDFAPRVQALLGARQAFAFDVGTACAGFAYGVEIARGLLQTPRRRRALVVASETTSRRARPRSKATLVFGDAAGAWVLETRTDRGHALVDVEVATDGRHWDAMEIDADGHCVTHIEQRALQDLATESFLNASEAVLERNGLGLRDVDWVVPHSGTAGIQALLLRTLEVEPERVLTNFATIGNVSSAAIPTALHQFLRTGPVGPGDLILSPTTGSGWYSAAMLVRL